MPGRGRAPLSPWALTVLGGWCWGIEGMETRCGHAGLSKAHGVTPLNGLEGEFSFAVFTCRSSNPVTCVMAAFTDSPLCVCMVLFFLRF